MQDPIHSADSQGHILHAFDAELDTLHDLALKMTNSTLYQLESAINALQNEDCDLALGIIAETTRVKKLASEIDIEVLSVLARHNPVANDLRTIISIAKISSELEKINGEITGIAHLILGIFEPRQGGVSLELADKIIDVGCSLESMLKKLVLAFWNRQTKSAFALLETSRQCEVNVELCIKDQLAFAVSNSRLVGRTLDIIEILKAFENCAEYCCHIAQYIIFMVDGQDVRHLANTAENPSVD